MEHTLDTRMAVLESEHKGHVDICGERYKQIYITVGELKQEAADGRKEQTAGFEMMHSRFNTMKKELQEQTSATQKEMQKQTMKFATAVIVLLASGLATAVWYIITELHDKSPLIIPS